MVTFKKSWVLTAIVAPIIVGIAGVAFQKLFKEKYGDLQVTSSEKADVFLNNERKGAVPKDASLEIKKLKPGYYFLKCESEGYEPLHFEDVKISSGEVMSKHARFTTKNSNNKSNDANIARGLEDERKEIAIFIDNWKAAWERSAISKNIDDYRKFYSTSFTADMQKGDIRKHNYQTWMADQQTKAVKKPWIKVTIHNQSIKLNGDEAKVEFCQEYQSADHSDKGLKTMVLKREGETFKISHEDWEQRACN